MFSAVAAVLCLQWIFDLLIPFLERVLVYTSDQDQAKQIQDFSERLLTKADARQLLALTQQAQGGIRYSNRTGLAWLAVGQGPGG